MSKWRAVGGIGVLLGVLLVVGINPIFASPPTTSPYNDGVPPPIGIEPNPPPQPAGPVFGGHPLGLPVGPVARANDCPANPSWSEPLPSGARVSPPSLVPAGTEAGLTLTIGGVTTTSSAAGRCEYSLTIGPDSVVYSYQGTFHQNVNSLGYLGLRNSYGQTCQSELYLLNFLGYAFAQQDLTGGYCNTDSSGNWSNVQATNGSLQNGPVVYSTSFNTWYQSYLPGNILIGTFMLCLENPVGQHTNYWCPWMQGGPYY